MRRRDVNGHKENCTELVPVLSRTVVEIEIDVGEIVHDASLAKCLFQIQPTWFVESS